MKTTWMVGMMMTAGLSAYAGDCTLTVYVNGNSQGPRLLGAEARTKAMFQEIGIDLVWRSGSVKAHADSCGSPILVSVDCDSAGFKGPADALAYALPYSSGGTSIHVFADRINHGRDFAFATALLAHVLAHEIGHVLEQICRHSPEGVMKAKWGFEDYRTMQYGGLHFAAVDAELIHIGIANRMQKLAVTE